MSFEEAIREFMDDYDMDDREEALEMYMGEWTSFTDFAWDEVEGTGAVEDWFMGYVDIEHFANDLYHDYVVIDGFGCVYVFRA